MLDWIPQKVNRAATEKKKRMTTKNSVMNTITSFSILHAAEDPEYGGIKLDRDEVMELRKDITALKGNLVTLAEARSERDKALARIKELEENMEDLYDEQGARDCCEDLGLVHQEDYDELKEKEETLRYQYDMEKQCHNDDIDKKQQEIDELKEEMETLKNQEKELLEFRDKVVSALQIDWNGDEETISYIEEMEEQHDPEGMELLKEENKELKEENERWEADDINLTKIMSMINALDEDFSVNGVDDIYECVKELKKENQELEEHLECEEDGYPTSDWFKDKLDFHIKYHFLNEGGEYYENLKDLKEKPNCLDDLIYGSLERLQEENKKLKEENQSITDKWAEGQTLLHTHNNQVTDCEKEINKLQAEVEGAGAMLDELVDENNQLKEEAVDNKKLFDTTFGEVMKLKEENEELKTSIQTTTSYWTDKVDLLKSEINNLQCVMNEKGITQKVFKVTLDGLMADTLPDQHDQM